MRKRVHFEDKLAAGWLSAHEQKAEQIRNCFVPRYFQCICCERNSFVRLAMWMTLKAFRREANESDLLLGFEIKGKRQKKEELTSCAALHAYLSEVFARDSVRRITAHAQDAKRYVAKTGVESRTEWSCNKSFSDATFLSICLFVHNQPDPGMRNAVLHNRKSQCVRCSVCARIQYIGIMDLLFAEGRGKSKLNTANETQSKYGRAESDKSYVLRQWRRPTTDNDILLLQSFDRQTLAIKISNRFDALGVLCVTRTGHSRSQV